MVFFCKMLKMCKCLVVFKFTVKTIFGDFYDDCLLFVFMQPWSFQFAFHWGHGRAQPYTYPPTRSVSEILLPYRGDVLCSYTKQFWGNSMGCGQSCNLAIKLPFTFASQCVLQIVMWYTHSFIDGLWQLHWVYKQKNKKNDVMLHISTLVSHWLHVFICRDHWFIKGKLCGCFKPWGVNQKYKWYH